MRKLIYNLTLLTGLTFFSSCDKEWLDVKSDISKIVPETLNDIQLLLNHESFNNSYMAIAEASSDDIILTDAAFNSASQLHRNAYIWEPDVFSATPVVNFWDENYKQVFAANVALEQLERLNQGTDRVKQWQELKGRALFFRSRAFYELLTMFAKPYDPLTAKTDPGISLRLSSDIYTETVRTDVFTCYEQVMTDLSEAGKLLPPVTSNKTEPSQASTHALLARVLLSMRRYDAALDAASKSLSVYNTLINYNTLNSAASNPFVRFHPETSFYSQQTLFSVLNNSHVTPSLVAEYDDNDLRKVVFFRKNADGSSSFKAHYTGSTLLFSGTSTNEVYLIRAECYARQGNVLKALEDLNTLLIQRYKTGTYKPISESDPAKVLQIVLAERRKELVYRSLRWTDLRRFSLDPALAVSISRTVNNQQYTLTPQDPRYTFPIPAYIVDRASIEQNPR